MREKYLFWARSTKEASCLGLRPEIWILFLLSTKRPKSHWKIGSYRIRISRHWLISHLGILVEDKTFAGRFRMTYREHPHATGKIFQED